MRALLGLALGSLLCACPGTQERITAAVLAEGCNINTDCNSPLVCAFRRCHQQCDEPRDCPAGQQCVPSGLPFKVCLLPDESQCDYSTDCPSQLVCSDEGLCRIECRTERDCLRGQQCITGACALQEELVDGRLPAKLDGGPAGAKPCLYATDCAAPLRCLQGACLPQCRGARDCAAGEFCEAGTCTTTPVDSGFPAGWGTSCVLTSQCGPELVCTGRGVCGFECLEARDCASGACCIQRTCRRGEVCGRLLGDGGLLPFDAGPRPDGGRYCLNDLACDDGNFCNGIELCVRNVCQAPLHPICDDFNPCTIDSCNATLRTCAYATTGLVDAGDQDGDGRFSFLCGGQADDCDDTNPRVFPGHPEECDFVDNNCNGVVDEGLWRERSNARISLSGTSRYPPWAGPPAAVAVDGGFIVAAAQDTFDGTIDGFLLDTSFSLVRGPVPLFGSTTQWSVANDNPLRFGKRAHRPALAVQGDTVLVGAFIGSAPGTIGCPAPGTLPTWSQRSVIYRTTPSLQPATFLDAVANDTTSTACNQTYEGYYKAATVAAMAWSPGASRWVLAYGEILGVVNGTFRLQSAELTPGGTITGRSSLLTPTELAARRATDTTDVAPPLVLMHAGSATIAWDHTPGQLTRVVVMDPGLNSPLTTPVDLFDTLPYTLVGGVAAPFGDVLVTKPASTGAPMLLRVVSPTTGRQVAGPWSLPNSFNPRTPFTNGFDSREEVTPVLVGPGLAVAVDVPQSKSFEFAYVSAPTDGGAVTTRVNLPNTERSGLTLMPIRDDLVGVLWIDGELKRTLMECVP